MNMYRDEWNREQMAIVSEDSSQREVSFKERDAKFMFPPSVRWGIPGIDEITVKTKIQSNMFALNAPATDDESMAALREKQRLVDAGEAKLQTGRDKREENKALKRNEGEAIWTLPLANSSSTNNGECLSKLTGDKADKLAAFKAFKFVRPDGHTGTTVPVRFKRAQLTIAFEEDPIFFAQYLGDDPSFNLIYCKL